MSFRTGERRAYHHGEAVTLVVRVRNVGKEEVTFEYIKQYLDEKPPTVTNAYGKMVPQGEGGVTGVVYGPVEVTLAPGKEIEFASRIHGTSGRKFELRPANGGGKPAIEGCLSFGRIKVDPVLGKRATGKRELEITSEPPAATDKKSRVHRGKGR